MALTQVPTATQTLANSQPQILGNFSVIDSTFSVNHVSYNTSGGGWHNLVTLPPQSPVPTPSAANGILYTQQSTLTATPELVYAHATTSTAPASAQISEFTSAGYASVGWTRLPSGILLKWGNATATGYTTYLFPTAATIPIFTNIYSVQVTTLGATSDNNELITFVSAPTPYTAINIFGSSRTAVGPATVGYTYLVIGV